MNGYLNDVGLSFKYSLNIRLTVEVEADEES